MTFKRSSPDCKEKQIHRSSCTCYIFSAFHLPLDIKTSHVSSNAVIFCMSHLITKFIPFISSSNFVNLGVLKETLKLFLVGTEFLDCESFLWLVRLTEHRETSVRILSWTLMMTIPLLVYRASPSTLDSALEVLFAQKESYGVKTRAAGYDQWSLHRLGKQ